MNITLTSLEALILKATNETLPCPDSAAIEAFCAIMRDSPEGPQLGAQALAARIHTQNPREAMLALAMLDRCMRRGDVNFQGEVGKFRFLNEMIKLVSPKYFADRTAPEVRTRVLQLFHAWSIEHPKESKFKVAYDMLKNQGVIKETPPPLPPEDIPATRVRAKNAIFEDEEKSKLLQKLLQSKKPEDLQHANRLIKTMVKEEERRNEASSRRAQEVTSALDSAGLLRDMLEHASDATPDEQQLIHELSARCQKFKLVLSQLASSDAQSDSLDDILHASDVLDEVFEKYDSFKAKIERKEKGQSSKVADETENGDSLLNFAGVNFAKGNGDVHKTEGSKKNALDELGDIFSTEGATPIVEPLRPVSLLPKEDIDLLGQQPERAEGWNELDSLGEQLLKQSLPDTARRLDGFTSKATKKIPMNALEKISPKHEQVSNHDAILDLDFFTRKPEEQTKTPEVQATSSLTPDDIMVDISTYSTKDDNTNKVTNNNVSPTNNSPIDSILDFSITAEDNSSNNIDKPLDNKVNKAEKKDNGKTNEVKPLTDIHVTLDSIKAIKASPLTVFEEDEGVTVVLHFCEYKPRPDVNVIVVTTTTNSTSVIEDYKFQAVVPKGCKVRLLTASGSTLPAYIPFLPRPALTQVMLVARPSPQTVVDLKFVVSYTCEEETCSEIGEVKELPLPG